MTKASTARKVRRRNKVVPIKIKKGLRLTEMERVRMDNCLLRLRVIQNEAQSRAAIVNKEKLDYLLELLPSLRAPTVSPLQEEGAFAVRVAVTRRDLPALIPRVKARGGTDLVVTHPAQIVP